MKLDVKVGVIVCHIVHSVSVELSNLAEDRKPAPPIKGDKQ
jgi:hypothetical protein